MAGNFYNEAIIAEAKANRAHGRLPDAAASVTCDNPLCGDRVTIDLSPLAGGRIGELAQRSRGCLLTQAAASVIGRHAAGATPEEVSEAAAGLRRLLAGEPADPSWPELAMFAPVSGVKSRHECVLLPFDALAEALRQAGSG
jgi:nitrogen fixation protein NifU and related proteins